MPKWTLLVKLGALESLIVFPHRVFFKFMKTLICKVQARIPSEFAHHRLLLYRMEELNDAGAINTIENTRTLHANPDNTESSLDANLMDTNTVVGDNSNDEITLNGLDDDDSLCLVFGSQISKSLMLQRKNDTIESRKIRGCDLQIHGSKSSKVPLVRIHSCCFTGETLGSTRCDCKEQLQESMKIISKEGGIVVYLKQEGRGIGLMDKLFCYNLIDIGYDTLSANEYLGHRGDLRTYERAGMILKDLGVEEIRLVTNNPDKIAQIERNGIRVLERVGIRPKSWEQKDNGDEQGETEVLDRDMYLKTKVDRMGHLLDLPLGLLNNNK